MGRDFTLYALTEGWVYFRLDKTKNRKVISISSINPHNHPVKTPIEAVVK